MNIPAFLTGKPALAGLIALAVAAGAGIGWAAASAAGTAPRPAGRAPVTGYACPGRDPVTTLHADDRVLVVGRDPSGGWIQLRDPVRPQARVWVLAGQAYPDHGDVAALPVVAPAPPCGPAPAGTAAGPGPSGAPSVAPSPAGVPATVTPTPRTAPGTPGHPAGPTTGTGPAAPPNPPPDTTGPTITGVAATPTDLWEEYPAAGGRCANQVTSAVRATVSDPSGVAGVSLAWSFPGHSGSTAMSGTGTASATLGGFAYPSVPDNQVVDVTLTITATDRRANHSTAKLTVHLHSASECLG